MVKGVSVKFVNYEETIPKLLKLIKFHDELKKHEKIVLKPTLSEGPVAGSQKDFVEQVVKFCVLHKSPGAEIVIAEGSNGVDTATMFDNLGYREIAENYGIGLIDLNHAETEEVQSPKFLRFDSIQYPKILKESFVVSLPLLRSDEELEVYGSLEAMRGAFPSKHYKGFLTKRKTKLDKHAPKYQIHDIIQCKMPDFALIDASAHNLILAGQPLPMDKQASKILGHDWREVGHIRLIEDSENEDSGENNINE